MIEDAIMISNELYKGGEWLGAARRWMQSNVQGGDTITWGNGKPVTLPFCKLEELALAVAVAAVAEERARVAITVIVEKLSRAT